MNRNVEKLIDPTKVGVNWIMTVMWLDVFYQKNDVNLDFLTPWQQMNRRRHECSERSLITGRDGDEVETKPAKRAKTYPSFAARLPKISNS